MNSKSYDQKVARLVQEATGDSYQGCLNRVRMHIQASPERMSAEERALILVKKSDEYKKNSGVRRP
jgi:hypothetical protein